MRKLTIAATMLIALNGCGALTGPLSLQSAARTAPTAGQKQERAKAAFDRIDADKNGAISLEEFQSGKGPGGPFGPPALDTDQDGKISFDEFKAHKPGKGEAPSDEKLKTFFDSLDTNKDGFLSADEQKPGKPGLGRGGPGHPHGPMGFGKFPPGHHPGPMGFGKFGPGHPPGPMMFGFGADADKDGKVTLDELKAAKGPDGATIPADKAQALFDKLDTNKDGAINKDDRPAFAPKA